MGRCAGTDRVRPSSRMNTQWLLFWCRQSMPFWRATVCRSLICQSSWARRMAARSLVAVFMSHDTTGNIATRRELPRLIQIFSTIRRPVSRWNDSSPARSPWAGVGRQCGFEAVDSSRGPDLVNARFLSWEQPRSVHDLRSLHLEQPTFACPTVTKAGGRLMAAGVRSVRGVDKLQPPRILPSAFPSLLNGQVPFCRLRRVQPSRRTRPSGRTLRHSP